MTKNKQNELTDSDYIQWMDKEEWSLTEVVYLLHGFVPPDTEMVNDQLIWLCWIIKEFPDAKKMLQYQCPSEPNPKEFRQCPEDWVLQAINDGMNVTANWQVIFFQMINNTFLNIHKGKPDYRRFIQVYVSDTKTRLGKLAEYVLNLEEGAITNPPADQPMPSVSLVTMFNDLLDDMNTALGINENDHGKLPERMVRPREFIEKCPPHYFNSASDCRWWVGWPSKYPKIAALKVSGKAKRKQQTEVTYVVTEYLKATDYKGGMPGLKRFMVDEIHAEFISADNEYTWTDPEGISYTKSKSRLENRLSDLKREHALKN